MNTIVLGELENPIQIFTDEEHLIKAISYTAGVDVVGAELTIDVLTPVVDYPYNSHSAQVIGCLDYGYMVSSDGYIMCTNKEYIDLRTTPYGTPLRFYRDDELFIKAYVKHVDRISDETYRINAVSAIGLLDSQKHLGNIYTGQRFDAVLAEIIGDTVEYTVAEDVASIAVFNWLPYDSKRNNLHQLLFAYGVMVGRNDDGDMHFCYISNDEATVIPSSRLYANGNVNYSSPASEVQVTEHSFMKLQSDETVVVYDNTDGSETANHTFIVFRDAPLHDLTTTGTLVIDDSGNACGVNYAIVTGTGTLSGKKYTHSTRVLTKTADNADGLDNVVTESKCTLVSVTNSENVATRLLSYYGSKKTVSSAIAIDGEKAGMLIAATDPFYEEITGFLARIDAVVSGVIKGNCKIITDFVPTQGGNNYTQAYLYTGTGEIDFAALVAGKDNDNVQVSVIGGGHGGYSGADGADGTGRSDLPKVLGESGDGGAGGQGGEGGKVFTISFHVSDLAQTTLAYSCGVGGASNAAGTATTLGNWSSADGAIPPYGIANIFTGEVYSAGGASGIKGGAGQDRATGTRPTVTYRGQTWRAGAKGSNYSDSGGYANGGCGGGAAVGSNGANGGNGYKPYSGMYIGGNGANGAAGGAGDDADQYGCGGQGGHGGGGGGGNSSASGADSMYGNHGAGGAGGAGGKGGNGLVLVLV